ncbi:hypothetical protein ACFW9V_09035 [Streptomyces hygroscopicus]|uniref:hypothetical protein n=1 Tax=Streptomyces hygroscopicus TaxID=1912 RepID=UPI0036815994
MIPLTDAEFEQAAELPPGAVRRYLRSRGWALARDTGRGQLWELRLDDDTAPPYEVLVPLERRFRDYAGRITDLVETLSSVEARRPGEVLREMALPSADWQYLRLFPPGPAGTAPLVDLVPAFAGLRELMTAAAAAAAAPEPQPVQPAQKPQRVKDFVAGVRVDQTRVGSYVIVAHTPLPGPASGQEAFLFEDMAPSEPFERLVSRRLYAGVVCARRAAELTVANDSLDDFGQYTAAGLSANLCEALVKISGEARSPFSLHFAWSPDIPVEVPTPPVGLAGPLLEALEEGAKDLKARMGRRDVVLRGTVVRLRRELSYGPGEVTVYGYLVDEGDDRLRRVRMSLDAQYYDRAAAAHRAGDEVILRGDLLVRGATARMERIVGLTVRPVVD